MGEFGIADISLRLNEIEARMKDRVASLGRLVQMHGTTITALAETAKTLMETVEAVAEMMMAPKGDRT